MTIHLPKVNQFGGGNGGGEGSSSFPIIVTDSGSSLPATSGYQVNDTFLNTSDKKVYITQIGGYVTNTDVTNTGTLSVNDGSVTFEGTENIQRTNQFFLWYGSGVKIRIHFKLTSLPVANADYTMFMNSETGQGYPGVEYDTYVRIVNKKLNLYIISYQYGQSIRQNTDICETELQTNTDYYLEITKNGNVADITLSTIGYGENPIETNSVETGDYGHSSTPSGLKFQQYGSSSSNFTIGKIYLADSTGEFVVEDTSSLFWDSGTDLTDKTEVADKTNGILYLYENEVLNAIPNLTDYQKKAETITIDTASVTIANVQANKNYVLSSSALTDITLTDCETSFEETSINFTTGSSAPTFTDNASIKWFGGVPEMKANTTYTIVIFNKQAYWQEQENV